MEQHLRRRVVIRQRLVAVARTCGLPEGAAPTERQFLAAQRALARPARISVYQVLKHGGALERGGWTRAVRAFGLMPRSAYTRPSDGAIIRDVVRVANLSSDSRACPTPEFYRRHGCYNYATVLRIAPEHDRSWYGVATATGLEPRSARYGALTRDRALFDLRQFCAAQGYAPGAVGPSARMWDMGGPYPASRIRQPHLFGTWRAFLEAGGFRPRAEPAELAAWHGKHAQQVA